MTTPHNTPLQDNYGRLFPYVRLSITDLCNFRCGYCLPNGYEGKPHGFLGLEEVRRIATAFTELGASKFRITGGEPSLRQDFTDIIHTIAQIEGVKRLAFTTNGYRLREHAKTWRDAGATHVNISVDSLDAENFHLITGQNRLAEVLEGVDAAINAGFERVKLNAVLLKDLNDHEVSDFMDWVKHKPVDLRLIELMQTGDNLEYFRNHHLSADGIRELLHSEGWTRLPRPFDAGPAETYTHPDYQGNIGIIAPYAEHFCQGCNRLRVTARGDLRLCLFGNSGVSLRHLLQEDEQKELLKTLIREQLAYKASSHFLAWGDTGATPHLASVGG